jgi:hypothetical protein
LFLLPPVWQLDASSSWALVPIAEIQRRLLSDGMIVTHRLSEEEFKAYLAGPMTDVTAHAEAAVDIWPYVEALDLDEVGIPSIDEVRYVYQDASCRLDQVLIGTGRFNAFLVVFVDRDAGTILGHFLLDLNKEYGVSGGHLKIVR